MSRTLAATGALIGAMLLSGCVTVDGKPDAAQKPAATATVTPTAKPEKTTLPKTPRPTDLQPTPIQDPCGLMSEERAREITGETLFRRPESPYYMPDRLRDADEPAYWVCHTSFNRLAVPREGLAVLTYDTTSVAAAASKYDEIVTYYTQEGYYRPRADQLRIKGAERITLLAFTPQEHHGYNGYGGVVVLSRDTVFTVLWTTKDLSVLKALAEEATATTSVVGK